jgi:thiol:disulfide interchange protein
MCLAKNIRSLLISIFACLLLVTANLATATNLNSKQPVVDWQDWQPQVFTHAKQQERLILLDMTARWCQFCRKMDEVTYKDPAVTKIIQQYFIAVRADEANYPELVERYKNDALPLTVVFDSKGNEIYKRSGYMKPQWMAWTLMAVAEEPDTKK